MAISVQKKIQIERMRTSAHIDQFKYTSQSKSKPKGEGEFDDLEIAIKLRTVKFAFQSTIKYEKQLTEEE